MRIVVATTEGGLDDQVSPVFGRAQTFTIVEVEGEEIKGASVIQNPYVNAPGGAGIQAAQLVASEGPEAVLAGNFGPNVAGVLSQAGIEMYLAGGISVEEAVHKYLKGELSPVAAGAAGPMYGGMGMGMGMGMGRGRRMGTGRGMWGQGMAGYPYPHPHPYPYLYQPPQPQAMTPPGPWPPFASAPGPGPGLGMPQMPMTREQEIEMLRAQARMLEDQLKQVRKRLEELKEGS